MRVFWGREHTFAASRVLTQNVVIWEFVALVVPRLEWGQTKGVHKWGLVFAFHDLFECNVPFESILGGHLNEGHGWVRSLPTWVIITDHTVLILQINVSRISAQSKPSRLNFKPLRLLLMRSQNIRVILRLILRIQTAVICEGALESSCVVIVGPLACQEVLLGHHAGPVLFQATARVILRLQFEQPWGYARIELVWFLDLKTFRTWLVHSFARTLNSQVIVASG